MRDSIQILVLACFIVTAILVVTSMFSMTLLCAENDVREMTHGLWMRCDRLKTSTSQAWSCGTFDWADSIVVNVTRDHVRSIQAFGTLTFISATTVLLCPFILAGLICCDVNLKIMPHIVFIAYLTMGMTGAVTWILLDTYVKSDVLMSYYYWPYYLHPTFQNFAFDWGAYVMMTSIGMTPFVILPVIARWCMCRNDKVEPAPTTSYDRIGNV